MVDQRETRIGDAERDRAAAALGEHYAAGRLDRTEFDARLDAAMSARYGSDLHRLFADLPDPAPFRPAPIVPRRRPGSVGHAVRMLVLVLVLVVGFQAAIHGFFPFFFVIPFFWARRWHRRAWR